MTGEQQHPWMRHFVYRSTSLKTTWIVRLALLGGFLLGLFVTRGIWTPGIGHSLVCAAEPRRAADAILIENLDRSYSPFEGARSLQRDGFSRRVLIPVEVRAEEGPSAVEEGMAELMTRLARLENWQTIPIRDIEPISLNAAMQVRAFLLGEGIRSVILVAPGFRSERSSRIYGAVLTPSGITVSCVPTIGPHAAETWTRTWHGIEEVALQFLKLQYYRFWVLPKAAWEGSIPTSVNTH